MSLVELPKPRIVLLVCDPRALYAYWTADPRVSLDGQPESEWIVRLHDRSAERQVGGEGQIYVDYRCEDVSGGSLSRVEPERYYQAVLGIRRSDGSWQAMASSNLVQTPPEGPSSWGEAHFVTLPWDSDLRAFVAPEALAESSTKHPVDIPLGWSRGPASASGGSIGAKRRFEAAQQQCRAGRKPGATDQAWPGNDHVRRAALPLPGFPGVADASVLPVDPSGATQPDAGGASDAELGQSVCELTPEAAAAAGGGESPNARADDSRRGEGDRSVEPLPRYGEPSVAGQRIVTASFEPTLASAALCGSPTGDGHA